MTHTILRCFYGPDDDSITTVEDTVVSQQGEDTLATSKEPQRQRVFTQRELDGMMKKERTKYAEQNQKLIKDLEALKERTTLSEEDKNKLEVQLEELRTANMTVEEQARRKQEQIKLEYDNKLNAATETAKSWQSRFTTASITREITDAAVTQGAHNPVHIRAILQGNARVVELTDADGQSTGEFGVKIKFASKDKAGKPVVLDLTPDEAVKAMKDLPNEYGNLFKTQAQGGLGQNTISNNGSGNLNVKDMSHDEYLKNRKKLLSGRP